MGFTRKDLDILRFFKDKILKLNFGKKMEYLVDENDDISRDHVLTIRRIDNKSFIITTIYKLSDTDIMGL